MKEKISFCENCGAYGPIKHIEFHKNIGLLIMRSQGSVKGYLCKNCIGHFFWEFTLITFFGGWWGVISFFITPFFIINNIFYYLVSLKLESIEEFQLRNNEGKISNDKTKIDYCYNCGNVIAKNINYCTQCGKKIKDELSRM
ncbi:MAG: hypothetical protein ABID67_00105 [Candidatus Nealsonbacteria bacterium]